MATHSSSSTPETGASIPFIDERLTFRTGMHMQGEGTLGEGVLLSLLKNQGEGKDNGCMIVGDFPHLLNRKKIYYHRRQLAIIVANTKRNLIF